jgi:DNA topoisomerase IA
MTGVTKELTPKAALIIEADRPWRFIVAADPDRPGELLVAILARMAKAEAKRSRRR